jgi:hypothetical protein
MAVPSGPPSSYGSTTQYQSVAMHYRGEIALGVWTTSNAREGDQAGTTVTTGATIVVCLDRGLGYYKELLPLGPPVGTGL